MNNKVYYKVLDKDMKSPYAGFQYELNKVYSTDEELELCECGFHACKNMYELLVWAGYNDLKDCRFFESVLGDTTIEDNYKITSNSITLIKEISFDEVEKSIKRNLYLLVNSIDEFTRISVALQGYGLDALINDSNYFVRAAVARQRYGLDILIKDEDPFVRAAVARQGYGLDILIKDEDWSVRKAVASQEYGLDILIHDENWCVRETVAIHGYGLDILIHDEDEDVRDIAKHMIEREKRNE